MEKVLPWIGLGNFTLIAGYAVLLISANLVAVRHVDFSAYRLYPGVVKDVLVCMIFCINSDPKAHGIFKFGRQRKAI